LAAKARESRGGTRRSKEQRPRPKAVMHKEAREGTKGTEGHGTGCVTRMGECSADGVVMEARGR
jgi:hypothetical protein